MLVGLPACTNLMHWGEPAAICRTLLEAEMEQAGGLIDVQTGIELLRAEHVVAIPTETVYGLAALAESAPACSRIFTVKKRPAANPLIVHVADGAMAAQIGRLDEVSQMLVRHFWPGPLTVVVDVAAQLPPAVTAGLNTVAMRCPAHTMALQIITGVGKPLVAPSANPSGTPSPTTAQHVLSDYDGRIPVIDGGSCRIGLESTVVRVTGGAVHILRPGAIVRAQLQRVGPLPVVTTPLTVTDVVRSLGTRFRHYAPYAAVELFTDADELEQALENRPNVVVLSELRPRTECRWRVLDAATLYSEFRRADAVGVEKILVLCSGEVLTNEALMDRLHRASQQHSRD